MLRVTFMSSTTTSCRQPISSNGPKSNPAGTMAVKKASSEPPTRSRSRSTRARAWKRPPAPRGTHTLTACRLDGLEEEEEEEEEEKEEEEEEATATTATVVAVVAAAETAEAAVAAAV